MRRQPQWYLHATTALDRQASRKGRTRRSCSDDRPGERSLLRVTLPYIFQSQGKGLRLHAAIAVPGVFRKDKLVRIALGSQRLGHVLIGENPVVVVIAGDEIVSVADMHPDA